MQFVRISVDDPRCLGAILAHSTVVEGGGRLGKGTRLSADDISMLRDADVLSIAVAVLDKDDIDEDSAATRLAHCFTDGCPHLVAHRATTGRVNLFAKAAGVLLLNVDAINAFNRVDPAITVATLPANARVDADQMVATIKIIPFAISLGLVEVAEATVTADVFQFAAFQPEKRCALIQTTLPSVKQSVLDKTLKLTGERLASIDCRLVEQSRCLHDVSTLAQVLRDHHMAVDLIIIFGASAVSDIEDVIPAAIARVGGHVQRVGMPVDPGNLLVVGHLGGTTIIGAPGCARSPKRNGFDWIIERWSAGLPIDDDVISAMGVGGLLAEIEDRPRPRAKR